MPRAFVHGNPETSAIWRALFETLEARGERDLVALSPPGFGAPLPEAGFEPSQSAYRDWLVGELEALGGAAADALVAHWRSAH